MNALAQRDGDARLGRIASDHGFTPEAGRLMWAAVEQGHGSMAQFDHPEFGGFGQWMRDGLVMLSVDDASLKTRIDGLCQQLARLHDAPTVVPSP